MGERKGIERVWIVREERAPQYICGVFLAEEWAKQNIHDGDELVSYIVTPEGTYSWEVNKDGSISART